MRKTRHNAKSTASWKSADIAIEMSRPGEGKCTGGEFPRPSFKKRLFVERNRSSISKL